MPIEDLLIRINVPVHIRIVKMSLEEYISCVVLLVDRI